ncbi:Sensor protein ZraS [Enhygromyxa salina]|uniref:histidine kinase n=1 Tax=Enhygromyxa salina TaxID=215803 RepID=A0A2S9XIU7_9BACT|nr:HAMP domain-containing sensor histidine kinase [Enhygromyxa salina]PRP92804.1 Sensor protein ZraS [Enhygromyxa salina]
MLSLRRGALGETDDTPEDELIGGAAASGEAPLAVPELPPLRIRGSLAARIVALVVLVVLGTGAAALVIRAQVRGLGANFDLLTGVYIPFQTKLLGAQNQSQRIAGFVISHGNPEAQLDRAEELNLEEALELRARLVAEVRAPLEQALQHPDRLGGIEQLDEVRALDRQVAKLAELVALDEGVPVNEVLADAPHQAEISRRFAELEVQANGAVRSQRDTVMEAGRAAEQRALIITILAAIFSLIATLFVILTLRPLRRLAPSVRRIGRGEWRERIEVGERPERDDEVARLAREVNLMAATLEERERRLLRGERLAAIGRLAAQITHEIRNPLSSVALNAELLEDEIDSLGAAEGVGEARQLLARISSEVDRLTQITEAYLGFARRPKPQMAKVDLRRELTDLLDFTAQEHQRNRVEVVRELPSAPVWVEADAGQLRQALLNLLRNAQEAVLEVAVDPLDAGADVGDLLDDFDGEPGAKSALAAKAAATIVVSLVCKDGVALVVVGDSGPGIPVPEQGGIERIFEAFVTSKTHGTGLGLPMVQQIAVDHGGAVRLASTGPQGTKFEFELPACDPPAASVSSENSA